MFLIMKIEFLIRNVRKGMNNVIVNWIGSLRNFLINISDSVLLFDGFVGVFVVVCIVWVWCIGGEVLMGNCKVW